MDLEDLGCSKAGRDKQGTCGLRRCGEPDTQELRHSHPGRLFWGQQPGQWAIRDMETRVCVRSCSPCFTLRYFHPWGLEAV